MPARGVTAPTSAYETNQGRSGANHRSNKSKA